MYSDQVLASNPSAAIQMLASGDELMPSRSVATGSAMQSWGDESRAKRADSWLRGGGGGAAVVGGGGGRSLAGRIGR